MNLHVTIESHTFYLFCNSMWRGFDKEKYLLSVVLGQDVTNVYSQKERKCHLLPVINWMKFVETFFQIIHHQLSIVHWVRSDRLHKHHCCSLSLSSSDVAWSSVALLTPYPKRDWIDRSAHNDKLTHLLLVIWWTFTNYKTESCHSLPVYYGIRLLITIGSITHKLLSWVNIAGLSSSNITHPLISMSPDAATTNMATTNLCFTQLFIGHLDHN